MAESRAYIQCLSHPDKATPPHLQPTISTLITESSLVRRFGKWTERTSTSPSGRHLGHYRALLYHTDDNGNYPLIQVLGNMLNIPLTTGKPPSRWLTASSVCLEKEAGNPQTDKIRIIHLFKADLNFVWKLLWGYLLVCMAERSRLYPDAQYGSQPGRSAINGVLCKTMLWEFGRVTRTNFGVMDNDATANYDRIICSLSSIACQNLGMPCTAEVPHNNVLQGL